MIRGDTCLASTGPDVLVGVVVVAARLVVVEPRTFGAGESERGDCVGMLLEILSRWALDAASCRGDVSPTGNDSDVSCTSV